MTLLDDAAIARLRAAADVPDIGDRYEVRAPIGHGGSSVVYAAFDRALGRDVAVKVADAYAPDTAATTRVSREARILAALEHPGVVPVHDTGVTPDGRDFYVMSLVRGAGLAEAAAALSLPARAALFLKVCDTVAFAHAHGVVHRDLKPQNVMVGPFGEVLVLDWGVATLATEGASGLRTAGDRRHAGLHAARAGGRRRARRPPGRRLRAGRAAPGAAGRCATAIRWRRSCSGRRRSGPRTATPGCRRSRQTCAATSTGWRCRRIPNR